MTTLALVAAGSGSAQADEAGKACAARFEKSQYLKKDGKLHAARAEALSCGAGTCPTFLREACQRVLADIDVAQPTVVLSAQDAAGADLVNVRVELDGQPFLTGLGAEAVPVDPGAHTFRFFHADDAPIEQRALVRIGEKNRIVRAAPPAALPAVASTGQRPIPPPAVVVGENARGPVWPSLVVGVVGLGAVAASVGVGVGAASDASSLRSCAPRCRSSDVADVNTRLIVSDVLLGVGLVGVGVAMILFFVRPGGHESPPVALRVVPSGSGVGVAF